MYVILALGVVTLFAVWRLVLAALDHEMRKEWSQEAPQKTARTQRTVTPTSLPTTATLYRAGS